MIVCMYKMNILYNPTSSVIQHFILTPSMSDYRGFTVQPDTQVHTGVHPDTKVHTGVHPDTQVHTGVHPDTLVRTHW